MVLEPQYVANLLRIDLLYRIVLTNSVGTRIPDANELMHILNEEFRHSKVLNLEDPPESPTLETVPTSRGYFRIISGNIQYAAAHTQTLLRVYEAMPQTPDRLDCLNSIYALLTLSELAISKSSSLESPQNDAFPPNAEIIIQQSTITASNAGTVFSNSELNEQEIDRRSLAGLTMTTQQQTVVSHQRLMNGYVESKPLIQRNDGSHILLLAYVCTAISTLIIESELQAHNQVTFLSHLLEEQEWYTYPSRFWDMSKSEWISIKNSHLRYTKKEIESGRFLHAIQLVPPIDRFRSLGFGPQTLPGNTEHIVKQLISEFWDFLNSTNPSREGISILVISNWGAIINLDRSLMHIKGPSNWRYIPLHFTDIEALGVEDNGTLDDLCRMIRQFEILSKHDLHLINPSGILNFYEYWRLTRGRLTTSTTNTLNVDSFDICNLITIESDLVRHVRERNVAKRSRRSLPFIDGPHKVVQQLAFQDTASLEPIYIADDDLRSGTLRGAVSLHRLTWWVHVICGTDQNVTLSHNILHSVLRWLAESGEYVTKKYSDVFREDVSLVQIHLQGIFRPDQSGHGSAKSAATPPSESIRINLLPDGIRTIHLDPSWLTSVGHAENIAELELAAAILEAISENTPSDDSRQRFRQAIKDRICSPDWRWLHTDGVSAPIDELRASGLIRPFQPIRLSAFMAATFGLLWESIKPFQCSTIVGEAECITILTQYLGIIHRNIANLVAKLDRDSAIMFCGDHYQRARAELRHWQTTSPALRAIVGRDISDMMLRKHGEVTTVKAATKILCEVLTQEPLGSGGQPARWSDAEEIMALLVIARNAHQLLASIRRKLIPAEVLIMPWGELVSNEQITNNVLRKSAQRATNRGLDRASDLYLEEHSVETSGVSGIELTHDPDFERAVSAEYGISSGMLWQLADVLTDLAICRRASVFVIEQSEISREICTRIRCTSSQIEKFIDRLVSSTGGLRILDQDLQHLAKVFGRLDRPDSMINRPIPMLTDTSDRQFLVIIPVCIRDSLDYMLYGLHSGSLQGDCWVSDHAKRYVGRAAADRGQNFEKIVGERIRMLGYEVQLRVEISDLLNRKSGDQLGDVDVLVVNRESNRIWIIEAKDLKNVRTITEAAQRMYNYRGQVRPKGASGVPDSMARHLRRVRFIRDNSLSVMTGLQLKCEPEVRGLVVVSRDQPMSLLQEMAPKDGHAIVIDELDEFKF